MSSPLLDDVNAVAFHDEDVPMNSSEHGDDDEGEGDVIMPGASDDSSEEDEDDPEEERKIKQGFIVDSDEEEEEKQRRKKRRKRHHRPEEEEMLEDDDLDLLEENTGTSFKRNRLKRLVRHGSDSPPAASSSRRAVVESSDDDLDDDDGLPRIQDIHKIWDDDRRGEEDDEDADGDMDDFIEYEDEDEGGAMDEQAREARRKERKRQELERRKKAREIRPELAGIDANAWEEIHDVFGDGHDYDWALAADDEYDYDEEQTKPDIKYQDVFEPTDIRARMLTEDDDLIRAQDIPERMQLATSSISSNSSLSLHTPLTPDDINGAALWVSQRLSSRKTQEFFSPIGKHQELKGALVLAVTFALRQLFIEEYEVPYIWTHKRDHISHFDVNDVRARFELLSLSELWKIYSLGQKYRSLVERRNTLTAAYQRLQVGDKYFEEEVLPQIDGIEVVADATEWLNMKYKNKKPDEAFRFHDDEVTDTTKKHKMPSRVSIYEVTKKSIVSRLAQGFGIQPHEVVLNFVAMNHVHFIEDQDLNPLAYAERFADPDPARALPAEELLRQARMIIATELGKDPLLRNHIRQAFKEDGQVSVLPTERGKTKIDEHHPYFNFKYLLNKPGREMMWSSQFLHMIAAENAHLVTISIFLPADAYSAFERRLNDAFASDSFSESAKAWNEERARIVQEVLTQHLIPAGVKWMREYLRDEVEDFLAAGCAAGLGKRLDVAPYFTPKMSFGDTASVLALSWGKGDPQRDPISIVFMDEAGRMRESTKIDNLFDQEQKDEFFDLIKRRKPDVIVIGGFTMATAKLSYRVKEILKHGTLIEESEPEPDLDIPVIYIRDETARIYQHSSRAAEEFNALSQTARYCVGMARYAQNPLNEYAALGSDIAAVTFDEDDQHLVPREKLLIALERTLVDVTNKVGVDINRAAADSYYGLLLPFVCGLGPRKAQVLIQKIASQGGNLVNRNQFIKAGLLTTKIFLNAAGFLRIHQEPESKSMRNRHDDDNAPDPLDDTRIHPEDYELARKMATDALELDEEDIHDEHPSHVVTMIMRDPDNEKKLSELNLDEFAVSLFNANQELKRHTLNVIREELLKPFAEQRNHWPVLEPWDVLTMLSGENPRTLRVGLIVSVLVQRVKTNIAHVRLDSGIEGIVQPEFMMDNGGHLLPNMAVPGVIIEVKLSLETDQFMVELSTRQSDVGGGDSAFRRVRPDEQWDHQQHDKDQEVLARKKRAEGAKNRRVIKHPNFHNFNTAQAENYLDKQQRGDVVIRPSSKGANHLAVTWKVDDKLYQHIDVTEPNADPTGQTVGSQLIVDASHRYADLDELIVNHVQAMARRVEELMAHDRFKQGSEDDLHLFLKQQLAANPAKSMYGFTLNRKRPGHFSLCFLANKQSSVQTWPVRVTPEAYYLFEAAAVGVPELCDAFKVRHLHESQNLANTGGRTPFGAGVRTPARTGQATPGHASVRQPARTPNPYGGATPGPRYGAGGPPPFGYQTPRPGGFPPPQPSALPTGMNPQRAQMIQEGGWSSHR
ncbi:uncharacterized protein ARMOST_03906 [Armillaria ostoyae]|uniref:Transcription elongation factor Spt6 n=1 Tax=Armillaria ostoyae TaxID=47428 RepID=A0A284QVX8_ARMOS|nr:uncharacterized protein ARMOST_03906 [Armillaria ostoyae]